MKWTNDRSENVDDRRGSGGGGGLLVGGGLGTLIIAAIIFFLGGDPSAILSSGMGSSGAQTEQRDLTPVSYTHLDVYKRQKQNRSRFGSFNALYSANGRGKYH